MYGARRSPVHAARSPRRVAAKVALAIGLLVALLWLVFLRPAVLGGSTAYVVVSGSSMDPTLHDNDLVIVRERDSYAVGDVIAFRLPDVGPEGAVIHRIVGGNAQEGFVTRGDNRDADDNWRVAPDDILGRRIARVPRVGLVLDWLAKPMVLGLMVGAALATLYWTFRIHRVRPAPAPAAVPAPAPSPNGHGPVPTSVPARAPAHSAAAHSAAAHSDLPAPPATVGAVAGAPWPDADPGGHDDVATRIRERFERADPDTRVKIRQLVFEQAMAFKAEDPDFDTAAFLRACGAHAYGSHH